MLQVVCKLTRTGEWGPIMRTGSWRRRLLAVASTLTVTATFLAVPSIARADSPPRDPGVDRANLVTVWRSGGAMVRAAAGQALVGSDADVEAFVTTGWQQAQQLDERAAVERLMTQGGQTVRSAAQAALDSADPATITAFLTSGWQQPWQTDLRIRVDQILALGGDNTQKAAQAALDASDATAGDPQPLQDFIDYGWKQPFETDLRMRVVRVLATGGPLVQQAAQAALDANTADAYSQFLGSGWALATARDQEKATIADLTGSAVAAAGEATRQAQAADEAGKKAAAAAAAAKAAAKTAADMAASAHGNAQVAAAAAQQAATAADHAAAAATEAISAASAATNAARSAAAAASRAAAAATRAGDAATQAYKAASAAEAKAGDAATARTAAQNARNTAADANTAAQAAVDAGKAAKAAAQQASTAASGAATDAKNAADDADAAASASGDASAEARRAHRQAAIARDNAARAQRAANAASSFAQTAADAASTAADAASQAAQDAGKAADAADHAADAAATAQKDATAAKTHADAAAAAAQTAIKAVTAAHAVHDAAVKAENDQVDLAGEQADQAAIATNDAVTQLDAQTDAAAEDAARRTAQTQQWITEATTAGTPTATAIRDARNVALDLADSGGPWVKAAAQDALGASDDVALDFVRNQLPTATARDDRDKLTALADPDLGTGTTAFKTAAKAALAGTDADVAQFLKTQDYPQKYTDLRMTVDRVLDAAIKDNDTTIQKVAQQALDDDTTAAFQKFLTQDQDQARATDERMKVDRIIAAEIDRTKNTPLHSKTMLMAQAALDGPGALVHQFLTADQYGAEQYDQQAAQFDAEMQAMLSHADQVVALAAQKANEAQQVAAQARDDANAANTYKTQAANSAADAAKDATAAKASADAAQASADRAAASAKQAHDAANQAQTAAHNAERSAAWADQSARKAAASAQAAQADAQRARAAALAAHQDAAAANQAARDAVNAANKKVEAAEQAARDKMRQQCHAYLDQGGDDAQAKYSSCLDIAAMSSQQRADLAAKNAATCQTLFPNHSGKEFNSCLQNTLDPAFDSDEAMIVRQMNDSGKWWKVGLKIGLGVLIAGGAIACILIEPCGAIAGALLEAATPLLAPELYGFVAATSTTLLFGGGAAVAEVEIGASIESDLVSGEVEESTGLQQSLSDAEEGRVKPETDSCLNSFRPDTRVLLADGKTKPIGQVQIGDKVVATDPVAGLTAVEPVVGVVQNTDPRLLDVTVQDSAGRESVLHTTPDHLIWNASAGRWTRARNLGTGDLLRTPGHVATDAVVGVRFLRGPHRMVSLSVAHVHAYYVSVGTSAVLVHNIDPGCIEGKRGHVVFDPVTGNAITDIDHVQNGVLWEEKSTLYSEDEEWFETNVDGKLDKYLRARQYLPGYEDAPIGFRYTNRNIDPRFKAALEARIAQLRQAHPDVDIRVEFAQ